VVVLLGAGLLRAGVLSGAFGTFGSGVLGTFGSGVLGVIRSRKPSAGLVRVGVGDGLETGAGQGECDGVLDPSKSAFS
jgi:hypothetical protein